MEEADGIREELNKRKKGMLCLDPAQRLDCRGALEIIEPLTRSLGLKAPVVTLPGSSGAAHASSAQSVAASTNENEQSEHQLMVPVAAACSREAKAQVKLFCDIFEYGAKTLQLSESLCGELESRGALAVKALKTEHIDDFEVCC